MTEQPAMSAATQIAAVIGNPVRHSLSPAIHNAAFAALGLDWAFAAFEVPDDLGEAAVRATAALGIRGLSITMPHKDAAASAVDRLSPTAELLGAVNCVVNQSGVLVGENTDGQGFVDALRAGHQVDPQGLRCVVLGAGGAARAVILALAEAGAREVVVVNRTPAAAERAARLAGGVGRTGDSAAVGDADLVVNATPIGMLGRADRPTLPLDADLVGSGHVVADLIVHPIRTPLLVAAEERGAVCVPGLGMLVHQAALAFTLWTGEAAPLAAMWNAVNDA